MVTRTIYSKELSSLFSGLFLFAISMAMGCSTASSPPIQLHAFVEAPAAPKHAPRSIPPATSQPTDPNFDWKGEIGDILTSPTGFNATLNIPDQVYTVTVPRPDILLQIEGMSVPTAAGIASTFHFYRCTCGKMSLLGEFIVIDYEANDVIDALRAGAIIRITAVSPIAIGDQPRLLSVRFHGEGEASPLAKLVKEAMRWTGEQRMKPAKKIE